MYVDTSVLVKLYIEEPDSAGCDATISEATLVSSQLLYCEFRSALLGKESRGIIPASLRAEAWSEFERDITSQRLCLVPLHDMLVRDAANLLNELHPNVPLRTLDALHLATYLCIEAGPIFTKDKRMLQAAKWLGLPVAV